MGNFSSDRLTIPVRVRKLADSRGHFLETYRKAEFVDLGIGCEFVQHNQAASTQAGTIRGLHFQISPHAQAKLVRVLRGSLYDAAVDLLTAGAGFTQLTIAGASSGTYHFAGEGVTTWHDF